MREIAKRIDVPATLARLRRKLKGKAIGIRPEPAGAGVACGACRTQQTIPFPADRSGEAAFAEALEAFIDAHASCWPPRGGTLQ